MNWLEKSSPPVSSPIGGIRMSFTSELMIPPKAAPIMTPIARSMALPLTANSLNSFHMPSVYLTGHDIDKLFGNDNDFSNLFGAKSFLNLGVFKCGRLQIDFRRRN